MVKSSAKYKTSMSLTSDFRGDSKLVARNEAGPITVCPADVPDCQIKAGIYAPAPTRGQAREIGEGAKVRAEPNEGTVRVTVDRPHLEDKQNVWVDLKIVIPQEAHGPLDLETEFGRVVCRQTTSQSIVAKSSFGSMDITCSEACPPDINANVETEFGKVRFKAPPDFQGDIDLGTEFGSTKTAIPIVRGDLSYSSKRGSTGEGKGKVSLHTSFGSVRLR